MEYAVWTGYTGDVNYGGGTTMKKDKKNKSKLDKATEKRIEKLNETIESSMDYVESLNRTIAQLEAELETCEHERDHG
jgi:hypothetical protein